MAVNRDNLQSGESQQIKVNYAWRKRKTAAAVADLSVIRLAKDRLIISWRKSPDKDTARYYLYRSEHPQFDIKEQEPLAIVEQQPYFLETYTDQNLKRGHTYFYKVLPEDWAGNVQHDSATASATTSSH